MRRPELGACREWQWYCNRAGYGRTSQGNRQVMVHRLEFEKANGPIPPGMDVLHRCDNPPCAQISHLFLGTDLDNVRDCISKGRRRDDKGSSNPRAKLSEDDVRIIRTSADSYSVLAKRFGVSKSAIAFASRGETWGHVDGD